MGKFSDQLLHRMRARRAMKRIRPPPGFKGMIMWCSLCASEIARAEQGETLDQAQQQAAVDAHNDVCPRRRLKLVE